jgi:hypothetical protein
MDSYPVRFALVVAEQIGLPVPTGAVAASGREGYHSRR